MEKEDFKKFLTGNSEKEQEDKEFSERVEQEKNNFIKEVNNIYSQIKDWLKDDKEYININEKEITITEEFTGPYQINELILKLNTQAVELKLTPIGTYVVGAKGRIDFKGPVGTLKFVLCAENVDYPSQLIKIYNSEEERIRNEEIEKEKLTKTKFVWKIISNEKPISFIKLDYNSFTNSFKKVLNG